MRKQKLKLKEPLRCASCSGTNLLGFVLYDGATKLDDTIYCEDCKKYVKTVPKGDPK